MHRRVLCVCDSAREGWWVEAKAIAFQSVEHCASSRVMECNSPSECV
jgi:hypothetical protein